MAPEGNSTDHVGSIFGQLLGQILADVASLPVRTRQDRLQPVPSWDPVVQVSSNFSKRTERKSSGETRKIKEPSPGVSSTSRTRLIKNVTSGSLDENEAGALPFSLSTRMAVIICVVIGLFVLTFASYTVHRKCVRDGWKQQYHKALFL